MKSQEHTPGPWRVGKAGGADSVFKDHSRICQVMPRHSDPYRSYKEDFANARLIAAAPELLEAAKRGLASLDMLDKSKRIYESGTMKGTADALRAAIAKAKGNAP